MLHTWLSRSYLLVLLVGLGCGAGPQGYDESAQGVGSDGRPRIVIVGAGLAGLTTADRLRTRFEGLGIAVDIDVLEAADEPGGRAWSVMEADLRGVPAFVIDSVPGPPDTRTAWEVGSEYVGSDQAGLLELLAENGIALAAQNTTNDFAFARGEGPGLRFVPDAALADEFEALRLRVHRMFSLRMDPSSARSGRLVDARDVLPYYGSDPELTRNAFLAHYDAMSADAVLEEFGARRGSLLGDLVRVAMRAEYGREPHDLSGLHVFLGLAGDPPDLPLYDSRVEAQRVVGGIESLVKKLVAKLGDRLRLDARVTMVERASDGFLVGVAGQSNKLAADYVVLTASPSALSHIEFALPDGGDRLKEWTDGSRTAMGRVAKLLVVFKDAVWPVNAPRMVFGDWDTATAMWRINDQPGKEFDGRSIMIYAGGVAADRLYQAHTDPVARQHAIDLVLRTMGGYDPTLLQRIGGLADRRDYYVFGYPWGTDSLYGGSYSAPGPGQWRVLASMVEEPGMGVFVEGEAMAKRYRSFMAGAVDSTVVPIERIVAGVAARILGGRPPLIAGYAPNAWDGLLH